MSTEVEAPPTGRPATTAPATPARKKKSPYPYWFYLPAAVIFGVFFVVPTFSSFFFSLTRWDLSTWEFIGLDNYVAFFQESALITGLKNTLIARSWPGSPGGGCTGGISRQSSHRRFVARRRVRTAR